MRRAVMSLLGMFLAGALAWLLWWWIFLPAVHFASLPIVDFDVLAAAPVCFAGEDVDAFTHLARNRPGAVLRDLQTSRSIATLANRLQGIAPGRRDTLVLYLRGHNVSADGKAWVLCSDYLRSGQAGRYPLGDLLRQLAECPAAKKLLIIDAGDLAGDPRLGMLVNEFPQLLEDEVRLVNDPGLWILASHRPLEAAHTSQSARRSAFGYFVTEGLRGAADANGNGMIELAELTDYVRRHVADWVQQDSAGAASQTPWLLHGGAGASEAPAGLAIVPVSDSQLSDSEDKTAEDPAVKQVAALLDEAWRLRDRFQNRRAAPTWTPIDYAPHLWRAYQELLLGYERRSRGGMEYDSAKLADNLRTNVLPLAILVADQPLPSAVGKATLLGRLAAAQERFRVRLQHEHFDRLVKDPRAARYLDLIRLKNELVFRATDYVRWHAALMSDAPRRHRLNEPLAAFLAELGSWVDNLEALESSAVSITESRQIEEALDNLGRQAQTLEKLRKTIEEDGLYKDAADLIAAAAKNPAAKGLAGPIDALLATPLMPAASRAKLLQARSSLEQPLSAAGQLSADAKLQPPSFVHWRGCLGDQVVLEERLVALADPHAKLLPPERGDAASPAELLAKYRAFGTALGEFYSRLPQNCNDGFKLGDAGAARRCERLLRAVDARDAEAVRDEVLATLLRAPRFPAVAESRLALRGPRGTMNLEPGGRPTPLELGVEAVGHTAGVGRWMLTYNPSELAIDGEDGKPVSSGQWTEFPLNLDVATLKFVLTAKAATGRETALTATFACGNQRETRRIALRLPSPDAIDMIAFQTCGAGEHRIEGTETFRLRPFPNRANSFRFELVNRSGREKSVSLQWFPLPELPPGRQHSRDLVLDTLGNPRSGMVPIIPSVEMKLPAKEDPVAIHFPESKSAESDKAAVKPEAAPPPLQLPNMSGGLACVIRDASSGKAQWIKWIVFAPRPPKEYVAPRVRYDARESRIHVEVRLAADEEFPPLSTETPITVTWSAEGDLGPNVAVKSDGLIAAADQTAALYAEISPGADKRVQVRLAVDGWPRAFVYEVRCDRDRPEIRPERDRRALHFTSPAQDQAFRVPLLAPIPVELQVDAPEDAFREPSDMVEVRILAADSNRELCPEETQRFSSDRQTVIRLLRLSSQGEMKIDAKVGDFNFPMRTGGLKNTKVRIAGGLLLAGREPAEIHTPARDAVRIILDGALPVFAVQVPGRPVSRGADIKVTAKVTDELSGVAKMEFGFDLEENGEFDKKIGPKVVRQPTEDGVWSVALPTKDLDLGQYRILVRATNRVGLTSQQRAIVTIVPPVEREQLAARSSSIDGHVLLQNGRSLANIRVTLQGTGQSAVTDPNGRFSFTDVPHGKYVLEAKGAALGREVSGSKAIVLPATTEPAEVELRLEW